LGAGLRAAPGDLVAIFDADFVPAPDFLRRTVPAFEHDPRLALLQTRWDHLNVDHSPLTQALGLALDGYFSVEQWVVDRLGLLLSFNGSGGVWRRAAIDDAGGWQGDTLAEDLDLSYRAHLRGWHLRYQPGICTPAELPSTMLAFKRQQFRWATGAVQVARKLGGRLLRARLSLPAKLEALLHLSGYLPHPLMIAALLLSLPLVLLGGQLRVRWDVLGLAGLGPVLMALVAQLMLRRHWPRRLIYFPGLILVGIGMAVSTSLATVQALLGRPAEFLRTPKAPPGQSRGAYAIPLDGTVWAEAFLAVYGLVTGLLALELAPGMAPMAFLYAVAFGYTAVMGLWPVERAQPRAAANQQTPP
jgi:hypothetical protein